MSDPLSRAISQARKALGRRPAGLFTDIDGTISAIASTPAEAEVNPRCREALLALSQRLRIVAVVSGRSAGEALAMVGLRQMVYVGNHGLETWENGQLTTVEEAGYFHEALDEFLDRLRPAIGIRGVLIERKGLTASIHYRQVSDPVVTRRRILEAIEGTRSGEAIRITEGRMIVEIRPPLEVHKGTAIAELVRRHGLAGAVYLGDDLTDLDAFKELDRLERQGSLDSKASIAVRATESPGEVIAGADATVKGVEEVATLLETLSDELGQD